MSISRTNLQTSAASDPEPASIETRASWFIATAALFILTFTYGAPLIATVALKPIASDLDSARSVPALAASLVWLGSGVGAIGAGWAVKRVGVKTTVVFGATMVGTGLILSAAGDAWTLICAHALFVGLLGSGAINVLLMVYVSEWFDRRRGSALALVSSGQYIAGALWPPIVALGIDHIGWRMTMLAFGCATTLAIVPVAVLLLSAPPETVREQIRQADQTAAPVLGLQPPVAFALLCVAGFLCCIPMAMPPTHLVALCSDLGIKPMQSATMLSVLLGSAFLSRQLWGWLSDRVGGLYTVLAGSACQAIAIAGFLFTQDEVGLFVVSAAFGLGFSGIIPAYVLALRQLFPAAEASWRIPFWYFINVCGMALGGWLAGLLYDQLGSYAPALATGLALNFANVALIGWLALRDRPSMRSI